MGERRQISTRTDRPSRRNDGDHTVVHHGDQQIDGIEPDAGKAFRQHIHAQRHRRPDNGNRQRLTDAGGVAAQQVDLQLRERVMGNPHFGEVAETGVDSIGRIVVIGELVDDSPRCDDALTRGGR